MWSGDPSSDPSYDDHLLEMSQSFVLRVIIPELEAIFFENLKRNCFL